MIELSRTVRICLDDPPPGGHGDGANGYGGKPAMAGLGRFYEVTVRCAGEPDASTGYLINIKEIDAAVREGASPILASGAHEGHPTEETAHECLRAVASRLPGIARTVRLSLTPTYSLEMRVTDPQSVLLRQRFDFAAAHRLHVPTLSDEENRAIFGKCTNPNGHGHNYQVEPCVLVRAGGRGLSLADLERITDETIIERFDHKHLNLDTEEFADGRGLNPTVENIARVCHELLAPEIERATGGDASLASITVWETDRTSATYPAPSM